MQSAVSAEPFDSNLTLDRFSLLLASGFAHNAGVIILLETSGAGHSRWSDRRVRGQPGNASAQPERRSDSQASYPRQ